MSKLLGRVELFDNDDLEEIARTVGYTTDIHNVDDTGLDFLDADEVWREAVDNMDGNGTDSAEVRIKGLDYIMIERTGERTGES